jgi:4-hydroxy-4-methyl-2-oxoglutarate aldolase
MLTEFGGLSTPLVADACLRAGVPLRAAPPGIGAVIPGQRIAGRALPARHYGSVDVFLEAFSGAARGDVLVVDNGGRGFYRPPVRPHKSKPGSVPATRPGPRQS